jgi:cell division protein FtsI (penicillin-binding protein 3)
MIRKATRRAPARAHSGSMRFEARWKIGMVGAVILGGLVVARLVQVQIVEAGPLRAEAKSQQTRTLGIPAARGPIVDRAGVALALTLPADRRGEKEARRLYPRGTLAAHVLGFVNQDHAGLEGLELLFEPSLQGEAGSRVVGANARGLRYTTPDGRTRPAEDGAELVTTIDVGAQSVVERELEECVSKHGAAGATAIFVDPRTGDILALASYPTFDPETPAKARPEIRRNRAITDLMEPGSTFKTVTIAGCLEAGLVVPGTLVESKKELELAGGKPLHDKYDYGWVTVEETMGLSVNTATALLGRRLGPERLYETARAFGFGCVTGIELPGEVSGIVRRPAAWSGRSLETISIGQEIAATPLQLVMAYGAIANDGVLLRPRIVREVRDSSGRAIRSYGVRPVRRVVTRETAETLTAMLVGVVDHGTATEARIDGVRIAGKTGTAQRIDPKTGRYIVGRHVSSFVGFLPAESPTLLGIVVVEEPEGVGYGGQVAAPCFRKIVEGMAVTAAEPGRYDFQLGDGAL